MNITYCVRVSETIIFNVSQVQTAPLQLPSQKKFFSIPLRVRETCVAAFKMRKNPQVLVSV